NPDIQPSFNKCCIFHLLLLLYNHIMQNARKHWIISLFLMLIFKMSSPLFCQSDLVNITPPELTQDNDTFTDRQLARIEAYLEINLNAIEEEIYLLATDLLNKPQLTYKLSNAQSFTAAMAQQGQLNQQDRSYLGSGLNMSLYTPTFVYDDLEDYALALQPEDDPPRGVAGQLFTLEAGFPIKKIKGLGVFASAGYTNFSKDLFLFDNHQYQGSIGYSPFRDINISRNFSWDPMFLQGGVSYQYTHIRFKVETGTIVQNFDISPSELLPSQSVEISVDPLIYAGIEYSSLAIPLSISTQFNFFSNLHLSFGGTFSTAWSQSGITLEGNNDVVILGFLSDLIIQDASVELNGTIDGSRGDNFIGYIWTSLLMDMGHVYLNIPLAYHHPDGLSGGVTLGVWF
ncbi:MAG: hypothetical protein PF447_04220, partial [Spirochaetaceae bacterium]|nr:hypothetical protein [Spirochaetaceae bacterium]